MKKRHSRPRAFIVFAAVICMSVVLDRLTKSLAETYLTGGITQPFIPHVLDFYLVYNRGAAWGMLEGARPLFLIIAAVTLLAMFIYIGVTRRHAALEVIALGLIAGGALGNGIDRALSGQVVDFVHTLFIDFPLFNIADSSLTVGVILFVITLLLQMRKPKQAEETASSDDKEKPDMEDDSATPDKTPVTPGLTRGLPSDVQVSEGCCPEDSLPQSSKEDSDATP
ncbi:MAG: signal peptidase II [Coriobacteriia bacterium]|nr:signal peptidase II [Coriobacteriia bacterium]